jgi:type III secretion apparatus needle protein
MGLDFDSVNRGMGKSVSDMQNKLDGMSKNLDPTNIQDMLKYQQEMAKWSVAVGVESTTIKSITDALKGITQRM